LSLSNTGAGVRNETARSIAPLKSYSRIALRTTPVVRQCAGTTQSHPS
jgi:hypothetical protein